MENTPEEKLEKEKTLRTVWMVLTAVFAVLLLFNLYRLTQGKDALSSVLSQSGMVFVGLAILIGSRNKQLSYVFMTLGGIVLIAGLVTVIISLMD